MILEEEVRRYDEEYKQYVELRSALVVGSIARG